MIFTHFRTGQNLPRKVSSLTKISSFSGSSSETFASEETKSGIVAPKVASKRRIIRNHTAFHRKKFPNLVVQSKPTGIQMFFTLKAVNVVLIIIINTIYLPIQYIINRFEYYSLDFVFITPKNIWNHFQCSLGEDCAEDGFKFYDDIYISK